MIVSLILAASENGVIGKDNDLPWHLPDDLKYFKKLTQGHTIIMGRKTYESIGRPLPKRRNIVVSRNPKYQPVGLEVVSSLADAIEICKGEEEVFIIGGASIYRVAEELGLVNRIYLTRVHIEMEGDTYWEMNDWDDWELEASEYHPDDEKHQFPFTFLTFSRK